MQILKRVTKIASWMLAILGGILFVAYLGLSIMIGRGINTAFNDIPTISQRVTARFRVAGIVPLGISVTFIIY